MKAVLVRAPGGADQLYLGDHPTPEPRPGEVLVRVRATALNRADLMQREGKYPPPSGASPVLGLEVAGEVARAGEGVERWREGDRVCALLSGGGYAEYAAVPEGQALPVPARLTFEEAAAIPEAFLTAYQALFWLGDVQPGAHVLIHAGASGVGTAAIQLVRAAGAVPHVTASAEKLDFCRALGAETAVDYRAGGFAEPIRAATGGVRLVLDFIGAPYWEQNVDALATDGRIVVLATMGGSRIEGFDLRALFRKRGQLITSTLRSRDDEYKSRLAQEFGAFAIPLFEEGRLKPVVDRVFEWTDVAAAHRYMEENRNRGKIVLRVG